MVDQKSKQESTKNAQWTDKEKISYIKRLQLTEEEIDILASDHFSATQSKSNGEKVKKLSTSRILTVVLKSILHDKEAGNGFVRFIKFFYAFFNSLSLSKNSYYNRRKAFIRAICAQHIKLKESLSSAPASDLNTSLRPCSGDQALDQPGALDSGDQSLTTERANSDKSAAQKYVDALNASAKLRVKDEDVETRNTDSSDSCMENDDSTQTEKNTILSGNGNNPESELLANHDTTSDQQHATLNGNSGANTDTNIIRVNSSSDNSPHQGSTVQPRKPILRPKNQSKPSSPVGEQSKRGNITVHFESTESSSSGAPDHKTELLPASRSEEKDNRMAKSSPKRNKKGKKTQVKTLKKSTLPQQLSSTNLLESNGGDANAGTGSDAKTNGSVSRKHDGGNTTTATYDVNRVDGYSNVVNDDGGTLRSEAVIDIASKDNVAPGSRALIVNKSQVTNLDDQLLWIAPQTEITSSSAKSNSNVNKVLSEYDGFSDDTSLHHSSTTYTSADEDLSASQPPTSQSLTSQSLTSQSPTSQSPIIDIQQSLSANEGNGSSMATLQDTAIPAQAKKESEQTVFDMNSKLNSTERTFNFQVLQDKVSDHFSRDSRMGLKITTDMRISNIIVSQMAKLESEIARGTFGNFSRFLSGRNRHGKSEDAIKLRDHCRKIVAKERQEEKAATTPATPSFGIKVDGAANTLTELTSSSHSVA